MKKMIVVLAIAMALSAATAFAIGTTSTAAPAGLKGFNPTNNVTTNYVGNAAGNAWAAVSQHLSGDKTYWTSSAFGGIAFAPVAIIGTVPVANGAPNSPTDSTVASGYTTM
jgi:hypothetical protein